MTYTHATPLSGDWKCVQSRCHGFWHQSQRPLCLWRGTAYSPAPSPLPAEHNIHPGDPLPDSLTGLLTATPYRTPSSLGLRPQGDRFNEAASAARPTISTFRTRGKPLPPDRQLRSALRIEQTDQRGQEPHLGPRFSGARATRPSGTPGEESICTTRSRPTPGLGWLGAASGARLRPRQHTVLHAGGAITTILTNLWQDDFITGGFLQPLRHRSARNARAVPEQFGPLPAPDVHAPGATALPDRITTAVPPNTPMDVQRFENDLAALTPGHQIQLLTVLGMARDFRNGYIGTYTAGLDHDFRDVKFSAAYVGTVGVHLASVFSPNGYNGADPGFAPFTQFNSAGQPIGGFGAEVLMTPGRIPLITRCRRASARLLRAPVWAFRPATPSRNPSTTPVRCWADFSECRSLLQTFPQNPRDPGPKKGRPPSMSPTSSR